MNEVFSIECKNIPIMLDENKIFFVEREYEWYINQYIGRNNKRFAKAFYNFDYSFNYLPESKDLELFLVVRQILNATHDINHALCKYAYTEGDRAVFYCVELDNDEREESLARQFYHFACWCKVDVKRRERWKEFDEEREEMLRLQRELLADCWQCNEQRPTVKTYCIDDDLEELEEYFIAEEEAEIQYTPTAKKSVVQEEQKTVISDVDLQLQEIARQIQQLRDQGVSDERIRAAIEPQPELSPIEITSDYRIMLPQLGKEIVMQPIMKALFLLFLRHPRGINFKDMSDYKDELVALYVAITDRIDQKVIERSINSLCSPISNSIHEKCTRIREVMIQCLGEKLAPNYCITGKRGEDKRIALPSDMVKWNNNVQLTR